MNCYDDACLWDGHHSNPNAVIYGTREYSKNWDSHGLSTDLLELADLVVEGQLRLGSEYWRYVRANIRSRSLGFLIQKAKRNPDFYVRRLRCIVPQDQQEAFRKHCQTIASTKEIDHTTHRHATEVLSPRTKKNKTIKKQPRAELTASPTSVMSTLLSSSSTSPQSIPSLQLTGLPTRESEGCPAI